MKKQMRDPSEDENDDVDNPFGEGCDFPPIEEPAGEQNIETMP